MKRYLIPLSCLLLAGCVTATGPWGSYTRVGPQQIAGFEAEANPDGTMKVKFESQKSESEAMSEALLEAVRKIP